MGSRRTGLLAWIERAENSLAGLQAVAAATIWLFALNAFPIHAQTVSFNAPFASVSQTTVQYGQGIVADAASNLYITGTYNLLYLQRNSNGTYTPASTKIDSAGGTAYGLAIDAANNLYRPDISPGSNPYLAKYIYHGVNSFQKYSIGSWTSANSPSSVAVDPNYNVYVLDAGGSSVTTGSIVKLTPSVSCSTLSSCTTYTQTTLVTDTRLHGTTGLSIDASGNFYISSGPHTGNTSPSVSNSTATVYKLIFGSSSYSFNTLGSSWNSPAATAVDSTGNVWVADYGAQKIYQLTPASSSPTETSYTKTQFQSATNFTCLRTLTVSKTGQLFGLESGGGGACNGYAVPEVGGTAPHNTGTPSVGGSTTQEIDVTFSSPQNPVSYQVVTQGSVLSNGFTDASPVSGTTSGGVPYCRQGTGSGDTCAVLAGFYPNIPGLQEGAVLIQNSSGTVISTDYIYGVGYGSEATLIPGQVTTYATAQLTSPGALITDAFGNLYIADPRSNLVRKVAPGGAISTLAGTGNASTSSDISCSTGGSATSLNFTPSGISLDGAGNLYIADSNRNMVCGVNLTTGTTWIAAGSGASCSSSTASCGDGTAATSAQLSLGASSGLAVDGLGNLLIVDSGDNRLRSVNLTTGIISTVAGTGGLCTTTATCGDGGLATAVGAYLNSPTAVAVDAAGDYLIADTGDNRIREVSELTGTLSTMAGTGTPGSSGDGAAASSAQLNGPVGITVDAAGDIYIADQGNSLVRMVASGNGDISTLVGGGTQVFSANPTAATNAILHSPSGVAIDGHGNLYISDTGDAAVEEVNATATSLNFPTTTVIGTQDTTDANQVVSVVNIGNLALASISPGLTAPTDFQQLTGIAGDCSTTFSLALGTSCNLRIQFYPQTTGSLAESFVISDNSLGGAPSTQTISLMGTGANAIPTISLFPSGSIPSGTVGIAYSQSVIASGGTLPYTYGVTSGSLPPGLAFASNGVLSGTPTSAAGPFSFTITATDSSSGVSGGPFTGSSSYTLTINQGTATVTLGSLAQTYTGSALPATATTSPTGLTVDFTYNGNSTVPTAPGSYTVVGTISDTNYQGTATGTLVIGKATGTVTLGSLAQTYTGSALPATATTAPTGLTVNFTYNGNSTVPTAPGSYTLVGTISDTNYQGTATGTLVIGKATGTVTLGSLAQTYTGSALPATATTSPTGLTVNFTYNGNSTVPTAPGSYTLVGTISDTNYQGTATGTLVIGKATGTVTLGSLAQTYTGSALPATATTSPTGLTVNFTYNGNSTVPTAPGSYTVVGTISDIDYQGSATGTLVIGKATGTVTLGNLAQTYTGSALPATATTAPTGLTVNFTYNGNSTVPTAPGSYTVVGTISDTNYQGTATGTLVIGKATATVTLSGLAQTYTGSALPATATTAPTGLTVNFTYNGNSTVPTAPGSYTVVGTISDASYQGNATGTMVISKAIAVITLGGLAQTYTGSALPATATTAPTGLTVNFTYNGSSTIPTAPGSYTVVGTISDASYQGNATGTMVISKAIAVITLGGLAQTYTGSPLAATATTSPTGLTVDFTYNGNSITPTATGSYTVVGTISDTNYQGTATGTLAIGKSIGAIVWLAPAAITYGTPLSPTQLDATVSGITGSFVYSPVAGAVLGAGANQTLSVTFTPADPGYAAVTQAVLLTVGKAASSVGLATNSNPGVAQNALIFTATISSASGAPTGSVTFLDGTTPLESSAVSGGVATLTTSSLAAGTHSVSAVYSGDANFSGSTSTAISQSVVDFGVSSSSGSASGSGGVQTGTVVPGGTVTFPISITPTGGTTLPMASVLTVSGLPPGATATLTTPGWTQTTSTSWTLPGSATLQDVSLSFHMPGTSAKVHGDQRPGRTVPSIFLGLLLLPLGLGWRRMGKRLGRVLIPALLIAAGLASTFGLTGCGAQNGFFGQPQTTYTVTVTITTGALSHSTNVVLTVE